MDAIYGSVLVWLLCATSVSSVSLWLTIVRENQPQRHGGHRGCTEKKFNLRHHSIYIGVDFHARQQTTCYLKTESGELVISELQHQDKEQVRAFYQQFPS